MKEFAPVHERSMIKHKTTKQHKHAIKQSLVFYLCHLETNTRVLNRLTPVLTCNNLRMRFVILELHQLNSAK